MKKNLILSVIICSGLLVSCGQQNQKSLTSMNNHKNSTSTSLSTDQPTNQTRKQENDTNNEQSKLDHFHYKIPKFYYSKKNFIKNGQLKDKNDFTFDQFGTEQELKSVFYPNIHFKDHSISFDITLIHLLKNEAKNKSALNAAKQVFNTNQINQKYYTIQVKFNASNNSNQVLYLNGLQFLRINQNQNLASNQQLSDESSGQILKPHQKKLLFVMGLINAYNYQHLNTIKLKFNSIYNQNGHVILPASKEITIYKK